MYSHSLLFLQILVLALPDAVAAIRFTGIKHTSNTRIVRNYLDRLVPTSKNTILHELMGPNVGSDVNSYPPIILYAHFRTSPCRLRKPGVVLPVIPDPEQPEYTVYWLRDGCRIYHTWLNELAVPGPRDDPKLLRTLLDDSVHALVRTQHVVSLAGNVSTGGLEEAVFDMNLGKITNPVYRPGSPTAGE